MKKSFCICSGLCLGSLLTLVVVYKLNKINGNENKKVDKFRGYYALLNQWLSNKRTGKEVNEYLSQNGYNNIAVYGMGELGNQLLNDLENTSINVSYGIDKENVFTVSGLQIYSINDDLPDVDVIVVTATFAFVEIYNKLQTKVNCPIISLEDIIFGI